MQELELAGTLTNKANLTIMNDFDWTHGYLKGAGTTVVERTATFTLYGFAKTLDGHHLTNETTANWNEAQISLASFATFENDGTFNANATTLMSGTGVFDNDGEFFKHTAATTTTMAVPFTNSGTVKVTAGSLLFTSGFVPRGGSAIDLNGGAVDVGGTLTMPVGTSLIGSGTLNGNLVSAGTVSPGTSPGLMTVNGDYTQEVTGTLVMELNGLTPGTEHDQLVISGTATLSGTLVVSLTDSYSPAGGDAYTITTYSGLAGEFGAVSLPGLSADRDWEIDYGADGVVLTAGECSVYLPLVMR
jgi:hypothetical protein